MKAQAAYHVPEQLYLCRERPNSTTTAPFSEFRWHSMVCVNDIIMTFLKEKQNTMGKDVYYYAVHNCYDRLMDVLEERFQGFITENKTETITLVETFCYLWKGVLGIPKFIEMQRIVKLREILLKRDILSKPIINFFENIDFNKIKKLYEDNIRKIFSDIPFKDANICIGIYGMGRHTKNLMKEYEKYEGTILCDYVFIDSFAPTDGRTYFDAPVLNIKDTKGKVDVVLVSTFKFMRDFNRNIDAFLGKEFRRINLYGENDKISFF